MIKFFAEFAPLIAFFVGYKTQGIMQATLYLLIASVCGIFLMYIVEKKISKVNLISTALLLVSGSLTLISGDSLFIKMKPTILYCVFAIIFYVTTYKKKTAIEFVLGHAIQLNDTLKWKILNKRFMFFFILMAILNEIVWRNFGEDIWVSFKVFGALPITFAFILLQMPFLLKNQIGN